MQDLRASGALATRSSSFLAALRFGKDTLGLPCDVDVLFTARVLGAVHRSFSINRITVKAVPITLQLMIALESFFFDNWQEMLIVRGCRFLAVPCLFSRTRAIDTAKISQEPTLEDGSTDAAFIETTVFRGKSIRGVKRARFGFLSLHQNENFQRNGQRTGWVLGRNLVGIPRKISSSTLCVGRVDVLFQKSQLGRSTLVLS